ncbi:MAG: hypothetical protein PHP22_04120 [Oscillospiraceae bacterium]|nr:hypothetical protein [Oscillospiraceae bacterium]
MQRELLNDQAGKLRAGLETASPMDEEFARAIEIGMPPTGGVGLGIDRLIMFFTNSHSISDVIPFPIMKRKYLYTQLPQPRFSPVSSFNFSVSHLIVVRVSENFALLS